MEANPNTFKNPVPTAIGPMKFTEESLKRKASFMVDDIVRDPNVLNSACSDRRFADSSLQNRVPQILPKPSGGLPLSKPGINHFDVLVSQYISNRDKFIDL